MGVPSAVARQEEAALQAHREAYPEQYQTDQATPPAPAAPAATNPPPGNTAPAAPTATPPGNGLPIPPAAGGEDLAKLKQQISVLQGKYNAEVPRLHAELNAAKAEISALKAENQALKAQPANPVPGPSDAGDPLKKIREDYGDDFANNLVAAIERAVMAKTAPISEKVNTVETRQTKTAYQTYMEALLSAVPKAPEINENQEFKNWLGTMDDMTGSYYQTLLENAHNAMDAQRVAAIFRRWPGYAAFTAPPSPPTPPPNPAEQLITPDSRPGVQSTTDPNKKTYTQSWISNFYDEVRRGRWKGKEKEQEAIEADISLATVEGRILVG